MQAQDTDGPRGSGEPNAFPNSESCGTRLWGSSQASGEVDGPSHWSDSGQDQDWFEESGLQFGSILRIGGDMSVRRISTGHNDPVGPPKTD